MSEPSRQVQIDYSLHESADTLDPSEQELLQIAFEASGEAYAPHSEFHVGCAIRFANGEVHTGNNQENLAYPSGLCAERIALFHAGAQGKGKDIRTIAIRARSSRKTVDRPVTPCGACRQVMLEYENLAGQPFTLLMQGETGEILRLEGVAATLMPFHFDIEI